MKSLLSLLHVYSVLGHSLRLGYSSRSHCLLNYTQLIANFGQTRCMMLARDISDWNFTPSKLHSLPLDEIKANYVRRNVKGAIFSEVTPTPLQTELKLVDFSEDVLVNILDMDTAITNTTEFLQFVAGNKVLSSSIPLAHRYGGYQFGSWAGQLGDGRAILLGEYVNRKGERWELQLKGAGKTPYSRDGDGRAVLRSSVREFLASEAMHYLGIPTSRAAALVVSDDLIVRDPLYSGHIIRERAAVVLRLAPSWFRFGSLEILLKTGDLPLLQQLTDFIIQEYFPSIDAKDENKYVVFFSTVAQLTLKMLIGWQSVGFAHGVLNTDNLSILGLTIDYGPFGFCEAYDPQMIPNHSDHGGRYSFDNQLEVVAWNLEKLSVALSSLLNEAQKNDVAAVVRGLPLQARRQLRSVMREKVGLRTDNDEDYMLLMSLMQMMEQNGGDFTMTFRQLGEISVDDLMKEEVLDERRFWSLKRLYQHEKYPVFVDIYRKRLLEEQVTEEQRREQINRRCPRYILRNWMAQSAIQKAENNDFSEVRLIQKVLKTPFTVQEDAEKAGYSGPTPDWANALKVSCSS